MTFLDICAGIGGFRLGMERAGHKCIGYVEFDKYARASYEAMYDTTGEWTAWDVTKLTADEMPKADCWCFGFPCQDISVAGKQKGIKHGTRSGIFYDIIGLVKSQSPENRPRWLICENVKNLLSIDGGRGFTEVLCEMAEAGYDCEWQVCNSCDWGVPQNRERVFIVGHSRDCSFRRVLPITGTSCKAGIEVAAELRPGRNGDNDIYSPDGISGTLMTRDVKQPKMVMQVDDLTGKNHQQDRVYDEDGLSPTLNTIPGGGHAVKIIDDQGREKENYKQHDIVPTLRAQDHGNPPKVLIKEATSKGFAEAVPGDSINIMFPDSHTRRGRVQHQRAGTLETSCNQGPLMQDYRIRKLTPREYWRLQGFTDELFDKAAQVNSKTQLYKQAGNAVTVNVVEAIGRKL